MKEIKQDKPQNSSSIWKSRKYECNVVSRGNTKIREWQKSSKARKGKKFRQHYLLLSLFPQRFFLKMWIKPTKPSTQIKTFTLQISPCFHLCFTIIFELFCFSTLVYSVGGSYYSTATFQSDQNNKRTHQR